MDGTRIVRIEAGVDSAAAVVYAGATALVLYLLNASNGYIVVGAAVAFAGCFYGLRSIEPEYLEFPLPAFEARPFEPADIDELLLTDFLQPVSDETLVLDDILAEAGPDSPVVRLFDPQAMPMPDQLVDGVDGRLGRQDDPAAADASQALHDALAELRRSLR